MRPLPCLRFHITQSAGCCCLISYINEVHILDVIKNMLVIQLILFSVYIENLVLPTYFGLLAILLDIFLYFVMRYSARPGMCVITCSNLVM